MKILALTCADFLISLYNKVIWVGQVGHFPWHFLKALKGKKWLQIYNCHQIWQKKFTWISIPIRDQVRQSWTCWQFHVRLKKSRFCKIVQDKCLAKILLLQNSNITKHNWSTQLSRKNLQIILGQVLNEILTHLDWNIERQMNLFFGSWEVRQCYITFERRRNWLQTRGALRKRHYFSSNRDLGRNF